LAGKNLKYDLHIPHIHEYFDQIPAIAFKEVGLSMANFLGKYAGQRQTRQLVATNILDTFTKLLQEIHERVKVTHRDIRPTNIIMVPPNPFPNTELSAKHFIPVLIDWGNASDQSNPLALSGLNLDYQADIVKRAERTDSIEYLNQYGLESLRYAVAEMILNTPNVVWKSLPNIDYFILCRKFATERALSNEPRDKER
jgi:serine/threonine protein kinase